MRFVSFWICTLLILGEEAVLSRAKKTCYPGSGCWPHLQSIALLSHNLDGEIYLPNTQEYNDIVTMRNLRTTRYPGIVLLAKSTHDVQKGVNFARQHHIRLTIKSSGHDFEGRSTWDGSLQIYLGNMTDISIKQHSARSRYGEATLGGGVTWIDVYKEVDKHRRVIIGGSSHTVSVGGYTQGGGHSPMSRMFGMAVDNLLEAEMVTADGNIVNADLNETRITYPNGTQRLTGDADLFWAIRGGGGGTWGVITKFTFKLHPPAPQVVNFLCEFKTHSDNGTSIADIVLRKVFDVFMKMSRQWGGYFVINYVPDKAHIFESVGIFLNHYGSWDSDSRREMDELHNFRREWQKTCVYINFTSFLEYASTVHDAPYYTTYVTNILLANFTDDYIQDVVRVASNLLLHRAVVSMTGTLIGGKVMEVGENETAVHPAFRHAVMAMTTTFSWHGDGSHENNFHNQGRNLNNLLRKHGVGMYRNEASADDPTWKTDFWGSNYPRLESIKQRWDPNNIFTCVDCVGNDL